jgi:hypothetical protein
VKGASYEVALGRTLHKVVVFACHSFSIVFNIAEEDRPRHLRALTANVLTAGLFHLSLITITALHRAFNVSKINSHSRSANPKYDLADVEAFFFSEDHMKTITCDLHEDYHVIGRAQAALSRWI